jgi:hypothetical protein
MNRKIRLQPSRSDETVAAWTNHIPALCFKRGDIEIGLERLAIEKVT